jgi:hypothetical protein
LTEPNINFCAAKMQTSLVTRSAAEEYPGDCHVAALLAMTREFFCEAKKQTSLIIRSIFKKICIHD